MLFRIKLQKDKTARHLQAVRLQLLVELSGQNRIRNFSSHGHHWPSVHYFPNQVPIWTVIKLLFLRRWSKRDYSTRDNLFFILIRNARVSVRTIKLIYLTLTRFIKFICHVHLTRRLEKMLKIISGRDASIHFRLSLNFRIVLSPKIT